LAYSEWALIDSQISRSDCWRILPKA
jgi:hypothetical protein